MSIHEFLYFVFPEYDVNMHSSQSSIKFHRLSRELRKFTLGFWIFLESSAQKLNVSIKDDSKSYLSVTIGESVSQPYFFG